MLIKFRCDMCSKGKYCNLWVSDCEKEPLRCPFNGMDAGWQRFVKKEKEREGL